MKGSLETTQGVGKNIWAVVSAHPNLTKTQMTYENIHNLIAIKEDPEKINSISFIEMTMTYIHVLFCSTQNPSMKICNCEMWAGLY